MIHQGTEGQTQTCRQVVNQVIQSRIEFVVSAFVSWQHRIAKGNHFVYQ